MKPVTRQHGFTLIEVLISILVLSVGLIGMAGLQNTSLKSSYSAYYRSQASWLAYDMADRMRANLSAAKAGDYNMAFASLAGGCPATNPSVGAAGDRAQWLHAVCTALGGTGVGAVTVSNAANGNLDVMISVRWDDSRGRIKKADDTTTTDDIQTFTYRTRL